MGVGKDPWTQVRRWDDKETDARDFEGIINAEDSSRGAASRLLLAGWVNRSDVGAFDDSHLNNRLKGTTINGFCFLFSLSLSFRFFLKFFLKCNQNCLKNAGNPRDMRRFQVNLFHTYALTISVSASRTQVYKCTTTLHTFTYEHNSIIGTEGGKNQARRERGYSVSCVLWTEYLLGNTIWHK